jgi:DNA-binding NarL/FixJ family response regulator
MTSIKILIVDDHAFVRQGLERLTALWDDIEVAGVAGSGIEAVSLYHAMKPDVVLMDLGMPGELDGIDATRRIVEDDPDAKIVVLTSAPNRDDVQRALGAGAIGFVLKHIAADEIAEAIRAAARDESPLDPKVARMLVEMRSARQPAEQLSDREREVMGLLASGLPNKLIARRLGVTERTVKGHLTRAYKQVGVQDRVQAALWATRHGITEPRRSVR